MASLTELEARRGQLIDEISTAEALRQSAVNAKLAAQRRLDFSQNPQLRPQYQAQIAQAQAQIDAQTARLATLNTQLAEVNAQIAQLQTAATLPNQSTGQTVREDQAARNEGASTTNPPVGPETDANGRIVKTQQIPPTNAERFKRNTDAGTNAATRKGTDTQSIPPQTAVPGGAAPNGGEFAYPNFSGGASVAGDDNTGGDNGVKAELNRIFGSAQKLVPTPNPLDKYASYTYNVSIYIMSPVQYKKLLTTNDRNLSGWQLLMQSGGAPPVGAEAAPINPAAAINADEADVYAQQIRTAQATVATQGRNQFFPLDYYVDDIILKSLVQGRGTRAAHGVFELNFKIYEPNGFTLFDRLYLATQQYTGLTQGGPKNYLAQNYLMIIKFYGYDDAGNLMRPTQSQKTGPNSDANAVIEKWFPFQFTQIRTKIQNKVTEYDCSAACPATTINGGQARGTIPYNVELTATTVKDLLFGNAQFSATTGVPTDNVRTDSAAQETTAAGSRNTTTTSGRARARAAAQGTAAAADYRSSGEMAYPNELSAVTPTSSTSAPPKADAAPKTLLSGLVDALNKYQSDLCQAKKPGEAPTYTYPDVYEIIIEDDILKNAKIISPGEPNKALKPMTKAQTAGEAKLGSKQKVDNNSQNKSILAGTSIVQFIEQILRTSSYITDQQLYTIDGNTGDIQPNGKPAQTVGWFHIGMEAQPLQYDYKRNDYAYKIIYSVSLYAITESKSDWFPDSVYRGTQKQYNYWFTGANTQVLDFTQELNALYYMVMSGPTIDRTYYTDYREFDKRTWQPRSDESEQGNKGKTFEPAANLADSLYSPADTYRARLTVVGDPDWMQQGEPVFGVNTGRDRYGSLLSDGSINFESQEPLFEILYNKPVDYDLYTGIMDPGQTNFNANRPEGKSGEARVSQIYRCFMVSSHFTRGKFTQEIEGAQVRFQTKMAKKSESQRTDTAATKDSNNKTSARTPTLPYTDPMGADDGAAIMAAAGTAPKVRDNITSVSQITYDELGNPISTTPTAPATAAAAPTSSGQAVGPAATPTTGTGNATGTNVGQPVQVNVYLDNGQVQQVTSQAEINALYQNKQISALTASSAANRLRIGQNSANNPTTATRSQIMARENG